MQLYNFFFFQAEDGIRDLTVTGVQTCALPISTTHCGLSPAGLRSSVALPAAPLILSAATSARCAFTCGSTASPLRASPTLRGPLTVSAAAATTTTRSEERRVGEEGR